MSDRVGSIIGIAKESTAGTFNAPDTEVTNKAIIPVLEAKPGGPKGQRSQLPAHNLYLGASKGTPQYLRTRELSFKLPLHGSGTAGVKPDFDWLLLSVGLYRTVTAATSVVYKNSTKLDGTTVVGPPAVDHPVNGGYSMGFYEFGRRYAIAGAMGNMKIAGKAGEAIMLDFNHRGVCQDESDTALPALSTLDTVNPIVFGSATLTLNFAGAFATAVIEGFEIDLGCSLIDYKDGAAADGIRCIKIENRKTTLKIDPEMVSVATQNFFSFWKAGTVGTFVTSAIGSAGNQVKFELNRLQITDVEMEERNGVRTRGLTMEAQQLHSGAEGDEFIMTLT